MTYFPGGTPYQSKRAFPPLRYLLVLACLAPSNDNDASSNNISTNNTDPKDMGMWLCVGMYLWFLYRHSNVLV